MTTVLLGICLLLALASSCHINVNLQFEQTPARAGSAQFMFYNGSKSASFPWPAGVARPNEQLLMEGHNCFVAPTTLTTFGPDGTVLHTTSAFLDGGGSIDYHIGFGGHPFVTSRIGVFCAFGNCGGRG